MDFAIKTTPSKPPRKQTIVVINKIKRKHQLVNVAALANHRIQIKESEKLDEYVNLAWELKKVVEHEGNSNNNLLELLEQSPESLEKGVMELDIQEGIETVLTATLQNSFRILKRVLGNWEDWSLEPQWKLLVTVGMTNSQG